MDLGPAGRGGARRRTRRRMAVAQSAAQSSAPQPAATPATSAPTGNDPASMLEMLKVLHSAGILNDAEYSAKKMQVVELL